MSACTHPGKHQESHLTLAKGKRRVIRIVKCSKCGRIIRRKRSRWASSRQERRIQYDPRDSARHLRYERTRAFQARAKLTIGDHLLAALRECEAEARLLNQEDDLLWKFHPAVVRYRRILRSWWALPREEFAKVADQSPTRNILLSTGKPAKVPETRIPPFTVERIEKAAARKGAEHFTYTLYDRPDLAENLKRRA